MARAGAQVTLASLGVEVRGRALCLLLFGAAAVLISAPTGAEAGPFQNETIWTANQTQFDAYLDARYGLVLEDAAMNVAAGVQLSDEEQRAGLVLKMLQEQELARTLEVYPFQYDFYETRSIIDSGNLINVLKDMPKGAALHEHFPSASSYEWFIKNATYRPDSYIFVLNDTCNEESYASNYNGTFRFFSLPPVAHDGVWWLTNQLRAASGDVEAFDEALGAELTLKDEDIGDYYQIWDRFDEIFGKISYALDYLPVYRGYVLNVFQTYVDNGVTHVELRAGGLDWRLYDLYGNQYNPYDELLSLQAIFRDTVSPDFTVKVIYAVSRWHDRAYIAEALVDCKALMAIYPSLVVGFDLQGAEDEGHSLLYFADILLPFQPHVPFYFHAGESLEPNNTNLYDAVLLNCKRMGHAYALRNFPILFDMIVEKGIGLELNPISNQILGLVSDMRNHAGQELIRRGLPVTISSDDPGIYGYDGTTYDWYMAFMAWELGIAQLKQIAYNSLLHSSFSSTEFDAAEEAWLSSWDAWVQKLLYIN